MKTIGTYKNGNYTVRILQDGTKIRTTEADEFIPAFAENCDCKITDCCDGGCTFCYEGCTPNGKHGNLNYKFVDTLHPYTELAINGNDMSHPDLVPFLEKLKTRKVIANMTVNQVHFERNYDMILDLINKGLINGLGISLKSPSDEFIARVKMIPNAVIHVINGIVTPSDIKAMSNHGLKILILGYKNMRRGADWYEVNNKGINDLQKWLSDNLADIIDKFEVVSFDNLAIRQLNVKSLMSEEEWREFYMGDDGGYTFYIDMVTGTFGKNSLAELNERFPIEDLSIDEMFSKIRTSA
ncbi:hypothetical protein J6A31_05770 [bacterium]|nr:hypothetical protein [bacterium]